MFAKADKDGDGKLICLKEKQKRLKHFVIMILVLQFFVTKLKKGLKYFWITVGKGPQKNWPKLGFCSNNGEGGVWLNPKFFKLLKTHKSVIHLHMLPFTAF